MTYLKKVLYNLNNKLKKEKVFFQSHHDFKDSIFIKSTGIFEKDAHILFKKIMFELTYPIGDYSEGFTKKDIFSKKTFSMKNVEINFCEMEELIARIIKAYDIVHTTLFMICKFAILEFGILLSYKNND